MQWWNDFLTWLALPDVRPAVVMALVILVSLLVGGCVAAWIAARGIRRVIGQRDRELMSNAIAALVDVGMDASVWSSLSSSERTLSERSASRADIHLRLMPVKGVAVAADWAAFKLAEMKKHSETFGYQLNPALIDFRDRLADWQKRPTKTRKEFSLDLERWRDEGAIENPIGSQQQAWIVDQHHEQYAAALHSAARGPNTEAHQIIKDVEALAPSSQTLHESDATMTTADSFLDSLIESEPAKANEEAPPLSPSSEAIPSETISSEENTDDRHPHITSV